MLILLSEDSIVNMLSPNDYLDNIILSHRSGNHIVMFENRLMTKKLMKIYDEDSLMKRVIQNIHETFPESYSLIGKINSYIKICSQNSVFKKHQTHEKDGYIFEVPIIYFNKEINSCNLLSENDLDVDFYKSLLEKIQQENELEVPKNIKFSVLTVSGGGSELSKIYENKAVYENQIIYSICDSDIEEEQTQYREDSVAQQIINKQKIIDSNGINMSDYYILSVREKENLLPPSYYLKHSLFENNKVLKVLQKLENTEHEELLKFVKLSKSPVKLTGKISNIVSFLPNQDRGLDKKALHVFSCSTLYSEDFMKIKRLEKFKSQGEIHEEDAILNGKFYDSLPNYLKSEYQKIVINLMSWSCSYGRVRR